MSGLSAAGLLVRLRAETVRMQDALSGADPAAPVPACPGWTVTDLGVHLGRVHDWAALAVGTGAFPGADYPPAHLDGLSLTDGYGARAAGLLRTLEAHDPDAASWVLPPHSGGSVFVLTRSLTP